MKRVLDTSIPDIFYLDYCFGKECVVFVHGKVVSVAVLEVRGLGFDSRGRPTKSLSILTQIQFV